VQPGNVNTYIFSNQTVRFGSYCLTFPSFPFIHSMPHSIHDHALCGALISPCGCLLPIKHAAPAGPAFPRYGLCPLNLEPQNFFILTRFSYTFLALPFEPSRYFLPSLVPLNGPWRIAFLSPFSFDPHLSLVPSSLSNGVGFSPRWG